VEPIALDEVLTQVANGERRELQILERRFAAPDHPVSLTCPESEYLKCLIARVW
jgi:23S rRNA (cytosine1962-C5)-methyltransferase